MKRLQFLSIMAFVAIFVCCANNTAKNTDEAAKNVNATSDAVQETGNTPTDVRCFGLIGNVKEVKVMVSDLISGKAVNTWEDNTQGMTFDEKGRVVKDRFDNLYKYDEKGNFILGVSEKSKMRRDEKGRIVFYENWQDDEDDEGYTINIGYDENDRMVKVEIGAWECTVDQLFSYSDDHLYPDRINWEADDEGDHYSTVITYTYKKFDANGNWTEREVHTVSKHTIEDDPEVDTDEYDNLEQREILYY